jgi:hypothetical protein
MKALGLVDSTVGQYLDWSLERRKWVPGPERMYYRMI